MARQKNRKLRGNAGSEHEAPSLRDGFSRLGPTIPRWVAPQQKPNSVSPGNMKHNPKTIVCNFKTSQTRPPALGDEKSANRSNSPLPLHNKEAITDRNPTNHWLVSTRPSVAGFNAPRESSVEPLLPLSNARAGCTSGRRGRRADTLVVPPHAVKDRDVLHLPGYQHKAGPQECENPQGGDDQFDQHGERRPPPNDRDTQK